MTEFVYILECPINFAEGRLIKLGRTARLEQRLAHHRSSFPGWDLLVSLPAEHRANDVETWLKRLWRPWSYKGSPECFLLPIPEYNFASHLSPAFVESDFVLGHEVEEFRLLGLAHRLVAVFRYHQGAPC